MGDLLQGGSDWLQQQLRQHASRLVTYARGGESVELAATIGRTEFELSDAMGLQERFESRDFLVTAADLVLGDVVTLPLRGDQIREIDAARTFIYEVMAPGREPHFRFSDRA